MAYFAKIKGSVAVENVFKMFMMQNDRLWSCFFFEKMVLLFLTILRLAVRRSFLVA